MRKQTRIFALVLAILTVLPMLYIPAFAESEVSEERYGDYYYHWDFENYVSGGFTSYGNYFKSTTVATADGEYCNNVGDSSMNTTNGGTTKIMYEDGNAYLRQTFDKASTTSGARIGTFPLGTRILSNAVSIDFKFRANGTSADTTKINLLEIRRGGSSTCRAILQTDGMGRIYVANVDVPVTNPVYTPTTDGFTDISVRWYDATNTVSVYIKGKPVIESARITTDFRTNTYVSKTWTDSFLPESYGLVNSSTGSVQILSVGTTNISWSFDLDDIKIYQVATPEGLRYYYQNNFEGLNSLTDLATKQDTEVFQASYMLISGNTNLVKAQEANGNSYLKMSNGDWFGIRDRDYQFLSASSWVLEFDIKNTTHGESSLLPIVVYEDGGLGNIFYTLYLDKDGNLYTANDTSKRIAGVNVSGNEWTHIAVLCVNDMTNANKFGSFNSSTTESAVKLRRTYAFYIDGKYVGATEPMDIYTWNISTGKRTLNGYDISSITDYTVDGTTVTALSTSGLTVVDSTTTANHTIYKSSDGLIYYDVEYTDSTKSTQKAYSVMTLTSKNVGSRGEYVGLFYTRNSVVASLDNIKLYEGNYPLLMTENSVKEQDGILLDIDYGSYVFSNHDKAIATGGNESEIAKGEVHGIVVESNSLDVSKQVTRYDASGNAIETNYGDTSYVNMTVRNGWQDLFFPYSATGVYSFEHKVKNVVPDGVGKKISFFAIRRENAAGSVTSQPLVKAQMNEDGSVQLYTHYNDTNKGRPLYYKNGSPALLEGDNWQTIKVIYDESFKVNAVYPTVSFYLDGQLLYLDTYGEVPAKDIANSFGTVASKCYTPNQRVRYYYGDLSDGTFDVKSFTIRSVVEKETEMSKVETDVVIKDNVTVIESEISFTPYSAMADSFYPLVELNRSNVNTTRALGLIYTEANDGLLYIKKSNGTYEKLYDRYGNTIEISTDKTAPTAVEIVYDDVTGLVRYYVDGYTARVGEDKAPASSVQVYDLDFYRSAADVEGISVLKTTADGFRADVAVSAYNTNYSGTAEIVALQNGINNNNVRIVAGVDSIYYGMIGFELETYVDGVVKSYKKLESTVVYESIEIDDTVIYADDEYGYNYFAIATITNVPAAGAENTYIIVRPYTVVNGVKSFGEAAKVAVSDDGAYFDATYEEKFVIENAGNFECSEIESFEGQGLAFNNQGAIFNFNADCGGKVYISLDSSRGLESVNESVFMLTVDGETTEIRLPIGRNHVLLAEVAEGSHAFSLKKISGGDFVRINSITLDGEYAAPALTAVEGAVVMKVNAPATGKEYGHVTVYVQTTDDSGKYYVEYPFLYQKNKDPNPYEGDLSAGGNQQYNVDMYRVNKGYIVEKNGDSFERLYQVLQNGEIAVAFREAKTNDGKKESNQFGDSVGGFHGDENIVSAPEFYLDGVKIDTTVAATYVGTTLEFIQDSVIDRCNSTGENILSHKQIYKLDTNGMRVKRSLEFLTSDYANMKGRNYLQMFTFARQDLTRVLAGDFTTEDICNTVNLLDAAGNILHTIDTTDFTVANADGTVDSYSDNVKNGAIIRDRGFVGNDVNNRYAEYIGDNSNGIYAKVGFNITDASTKVDSAYIRVRKGIFDPAQIDPENPTSLESGVHGDNKWYPSFTSVNDPNVCIDTVENEYSNNDAIWYPHAGETWNVDLLYYIDYAPNN